MTTNRVATDIVKAALKTPKSKGYDRIYREPLQRGTLTKGGMLSSNVSGYSLKFFGLHRGPMSQAEVDALRQKLYAIHCTAEFGVSCRGSAWIRVWQEVK